jgi:hypothetical protein
LDRDVPFSKQVRKLSRLFADTPRASSKQVTAPVDARDELVIEGATWRYLLLRFPQPNGAPLVVHFAERPFDGQTYISVSLDGRGDLAADKAQLIGIIASLR